MQRANGTTRSRRAATLAVAVLPIVLAAIFGIEALPSHPASAAGTNSIVTADVGGILGDDVGQDTSLALDSSGNPVVSYYDVTNGDLKVLHCDDPNCIGGGESITSPDTVGDVGRYSSIALDSSDYPVVSYYDAPTAMSPTGDLKVLRCDNPNCSGDQSGNIQTPDPAGDVRDVGQYTSLELDGSGNPVVSYLDAYHVDLKILHCNDPNCAGGDESITSPDTSGNVGYYSSLELGASGNPVASYRDGTNEVLKVMHCNDPYCAGGDESITSPDTVGDVGLYTSLALDKAGNPVVSYREAAPVADLKLLHCDDPNCSGDESEHIHSPDTEGDVGRYSSIGLDKSNFPVISYYDDTNNDLKLMHCNDPYCAGGDESITSPDTVGDADSFSSLALDARGNPVVSYYDAPTNGNLKVLHCINRNCTLAPDSDLDGCTDMAEQQTTPGSESSCGRRNPKLFWDFFDVPPRDRAVSGLDFFAVLSRFNAEGDPDGDPLSPPPPAPAYHTAFDRTPPGMGQDAWDTGPPDGAISGIDFFLVLAQFNHSCAPM